MSTKQSLSKRDICTKYITPAIISAGWNIDTQVLEEVSFTDGKIFVKGKLTARGKSKRADYILYYRSNIVIAIIERKVMEALLQKHADDGITIIDKGEVLSIDPI